MSHEHPLRYRVTATRHGHVMHSQIAPTRDEADELVARFARVDGTIVDVAEVHDPAETDLTAHTRELIEDLQATRSGHLEHE